MFTHFSFNRLFVYVAALTVVAAGMPACGATQNPEVEVDLSVLQDLPARPQPVPVNNPAPVEITPLQPGYVSHAEPEQPAVSEPAPPAKSAPAPKPKAVHKAAVVKKKKPPVRHPHHVPPPAHKPQTATAKTPKKAPVAAAAAQAPANPAPPQPVAIKTVPPTTAPMPTAPVPPVLTAPEKPAQVPPQTPPASPQPAAINKTAVVPVPVPVPPAAPAGMTPEKTAPPASVTAQPSDEKQNVPRPPPADSRETSHFSIPFKAGVADQLDSQITSTLQSQILPLLKDHPAWRLRINAFASPVDSEPISARRVSLARALAVRSWLLDKGVAARRMDVRAAGLETGPEPADRVDMVFLDPDGG